MICDYYRRFRRSTALMRLLIFIITIMLVLPVGLFSPLGVQAAETTVQWTGAADNGSWHTAGNWNPEQAPANGDTVIIPNASVVEYAYDNTTVTLQCEGNITVSGGTLGTAETSAVSGNLVNNSKILVDSGTLTLSGGGSGPGIFEVPGGRLLEFKGGQTYTIDGNIIDSGNCANLKVLDENTAVAFNGTYNIANTTVGANTSVVWNGTPQLPTLNNTGNAVFNSNAGINMLTFSSGTIGGTGDISINGSNTWGWTGGTMEGTGSLIIGSQGVLPVRGTNEKYLNRNLVNNGVINFSQQPLTVASSAAFQNAGTVTIATASDLTIANYTQTGAGKLQFNISGSTPSKLNSNAPNLAGNLHLEFVDGYDPAAETSFDLLTYTTKPSTEFSSVTSNLTGKTLETTYGNNKLTVTVKNVVTDSTPPQVTAYTPAKDAVVAASTDELVLALDETVYGVDNKCINIYEISTNAYPDWLALSVYANHQNTANFTGNGTNTVTFILPDTFNFQSGKSYYILIAQGAFKDAANNEYAGLDDKTVWTFSILNDTVPPVWTTNYPKINPFSIEQECFRIFGNISEAGQVYYVVLNDGAGEPTASQVKNGYDSSDQQLADNLIGSIAFSGGNNEETFWVGGLTPNTAYDVYIVAEDNAGNLQSAPVKLEATTMAASTSGRWLKVRAGDSTTVALDTSSALWSWGNNSVGQSGDGTTQTKNIPTPLNQGNQWITMVSGAHHTLALKSDKTLWAWGFNNFGQIGNGNEIEQHSPIQIGTDRWISIAAGYEASAGIKEDGTLWTWGRNNGGKLGLGDDIDRAVLTPAQVGTDNDWRSVSVGKSHCLATKTDGTLWAWGYDGWGQIGNGDSSVTVLTPQQIGNDTDWRLVSASKGVGSGGNFSLGLKTDGTLWTWGCNEYGILGVPRGTKSFSPIPLQVNADTDWQLAETGSDHILALKNNGTLWAWGNNYSGQLGTLPIKEQRYTITQVNNDTDWNTLAAGNRSSYAIKSNGTMWSWGQNTNGKLGNGTTANHMLPEEIGLQTLSDSDAVAADKAALTWNSIKGGNVNQNDVTVNLTNQLPATGDNGTIISWNADPAGWVNTTTGAVTRPTSSEGNKTVTLTATISKGTASDTVIFLLTVTALPADGAGGSSGGSSGGGSSASSTTSVQTINALVKAGTYQETCPISLDSVRERAIVRLDTETFNSVFERAGVNNEGLKEINVSFPPVQNTNAYILGLPASVMAAGNADRTVNMSSEWGNMVLPCNMLQNTELATAGDIEFTFAEYDKSQLPDGVRNMIGDRPVVELKITAGNQTIAWNNPNTPVTVSISYTPTAEELANPENITVWYIDGSGNAFSVPSGRYDPGTGMVTFKTTHFSKYAVVYVNKTFDDLSGVTWARKQIEVLTSKGILKGISDKKYNPQANITRADFLYSLVRTLGLEAKADSNFDDINSAAYYYREIGIAKKLGIASGTGNNQYNPNASITRQDMMALTERALRMFKNLPEQGKTLDLEKFTDKSLVADYAVRSVASMVKEDLIKGSNNQINPRGNTTRAETAVFLYRIYNKY